MAGSAAAKATAGVLLRAFLEEQYEAIEAGDTGLRNGTGAVHPTRVATRRLRSTLRAYAPFFDADRARRLDEELGWFAGLLGQLRDVDVQRARLHDRLDSLPDAVIVGPVRARIDTFLEARAQRARAALDAAMAKSRYAELLAECQVWATDPPLTPRADEKAAILRRSVQRATRQVGKTLAAALEEDDDELLHRARKQGKRARYAAELAASALGGKARKRARTYERLQAILGEHQDAMVAAELLRRMADTVTAVPSENGFSFGVMYAEELRKAAKSRRRAIAWARKL